MRRHVLLFDLDGTLVDSAKGIAAALNALRAGRGGAALPVGAVRPLVALGAEGLVARGLGALATDPRNDLATFRAHLAEVPSDPATIYPGAAQALDALAAVGWRMGVVTNKPEGLARKLLCDLDLDRQFKVIVGGDTTASPKPSAVPVRYALDRLDAEANAALFIGDSPIDAAAARACAVPFLLFTGGYCAGDCAAEECHGRFDRFADLPALVAV